MALYTYRPKKGIGKDLPEEELEEFNCITYEKIVNMTDMKKLLRLEQYMREEEFTQTSQLARKRIVELGGKDMCPNDVDPQFCDLDAEYDEFLKNFDTWQESMKEADSNLLDMHECKEEEQPSMTMESLSNQPRKRSLISDDSTNKEIPTPKLKKKTDLRSGRFYYEQWDKYASSAEKEIEVEEKEAQKNTEEKKTNLIDHTHCKEAFKKETLQQRLLAIGKSKSMTERKWFAEREREKGNDLFKAKEYSASIDAYSMAIELFPKSPLAYGNRAASNLKLKKWEDVIKDCCIAIELDGKYMKAYMRQGLANLEMDNPEKAMIDLQKALELDSNNQETQTIIRRAEFMLKKLEEKRAIEIELERKRQEEIELQKIKEEIEIFKNLTNSSTCMQMIIEDDEDLEIEEAEEVEDAKIKEDKDSSTQKVKTFIYNNDFETKEFEETDSSEVETKETKKTFNWLNKQHKSKFQECELNIKNDVANNDNILKSTHDENNSQPKKTISWPSRSHKQTIQPKNAKKTNDTIAKSMENGKDLNSIACNVENKQEIPKIKNNTFDTILDHQSKELDSSANEEERMDSKLCDVDLPLEIIEAMKTQDSIPTDHVAFGQAPNKHQQFPTWKLDSKVKVNPHLKASNDILAEEWRLSGNSFFTQGKFHDATECYTTSLKYCKSVTAYSNRAISRIKLKNYRGAEEDATHAISMDCKFHKAYYRRGLARCALGNLQGARTDFEEVLKITPNDKEVIEHLTSIDSEYIPMRSGPMIIEEVEDEEEFVKNGVNTLHSMQNAKESGFYNSNDVAMDFDYDKNNLTSTVCNENDNGHFIKKTCIDSEFDGIVVENDHIHNHVSSIVNSQQPGDKICKPNIAKNNSEDQHVLNSNKSFTNIKSSHLVHNTIIDESKTSNHIIENKYEDKLEQQAEEEKEKGNKCFKREQYTLAIECYTRSLEYTPKNAAVLANRALCYIHLHEYKKALKDSTEAIEFAPGYMKAFHRRAVAAHKLGDLENALQDYQIVATFLSNDKKLQKVINNLEIEIQCTASMDATMPTLTKSQPILIAEVNEDDNVLLKPIKTTIYKDQHKTSIMQEENPQSNLNIENVCNTDTSSISNVNSIKDNGGTKMTPIEVLKNIKSVKIKMPQKPTTALEFERVCNTLKEKPDLAREYVKSIETHKYPKIFKESLSASILQCFIYVLRKGFMPTDPMGAVNVLRGLTKVKRFSLTLLLVPSSDKQGLDTLFYWLEFSSETPIDEIQELRKKFHIL